MTHDPLDRITSRLRDSISDHGDVDGLPPGRDVAIRAIAEALRERGHARRRRRVYAALATAAALLLGISVSALVARRTSSVEQGKATDLGRMSDPLGSVTALRDGHAESLARGARVVEGTELVTASASEAHLDFDNGSRVTLGGAARVRLVEQSARKRFALSAGTVTARVAKLGAQERFVVTTPDAEIEVRGTAFRVSVVAPDPSCEGGTPTRVVVDEGIVVVRHGGREDRVVAGGKWPSCGSGPSAAASSLAASTALPGPVLTAPSASTRGAAHAPAGSHAPLDPTSKLAEQNDLFDEAMRAKRAGDLPAALAKLDHLRATYPGGPLAENAEVERMRILATTSRPRAVHAAREYLRRRPSGFARAEAEALVAAEP